MRRGTWSLLVITSVLGVGLWRWGLPAAEARTQGRSVAPLSSGLVAPSRVIGAELTEGLSRGQAAQHAERAREARLAAALRPMPDLTQTDPELGVVGGGDAWCGPVAVSNALMWLADQGHEALLPPGPSPHARQLELVRQLGSRRYMGTSPVGGTGVGHLLQGLDAYVRERGVSYRRLRYQGWRGHPARFSTPGRSASFEFVEQALADGGVALLHAGWYTPFVRGGAELKRRGGHWLTVVGAGVDPNGEAAPGWLVVHDPAPYAGEAGQHHFVKLTPLERGWLFAEGGGFSAKGYLQLEGGMQLKREGDVAVLDGAVVLVPER